MANGVRRDVLTRRHFSHTGLSTRARRLLCTLHRETWAHPQSLATEAHTYSGLAKGCLLYRRKLYFDERMSYN